MIEFRCGSCHRLLQVTDDLVGRDARCPACSSINQVPPATQSPNPAADSAANPTSSGGASNENFAATLPYERSSTAYTANPYRFTHADGATSTSAAPVRTIRPTLINVNDILAKSWQIFTANLGSVIGASLIVYLLDSVCGVLINSLYNGAADSSSDVANVLIWLITFVASTAFTVWLTAGLMLYLLRIARGEPAHFGQIFEAGPLVIPASIASVAYALICTLGLIACIVPGIVLGLTYWMSLTLVVDARLGVADAFRTSQQVTNNNKWSLAGIWAISIGLAVAGGLACGVGLVLTMPFVAVLQTVTYLAMTGQPIAVTPVVPAKA